MPPIPADQQDPYPGAGRSGAAADDGRAGLTAPGKGARGPPAADDAYLPARRVWERYGISDMTLHRWIHDERMEFPKPIYLGRLRYWRISDLLRWEQERAARRVAA